MGEGPQSNVRPVTEKPVERPWPMSYKRDSTNEGEGGLLRRYG